MSTLNEKITRAAERTAEGAVAHVESVPVVETFRGQVIWEGVVEVFEACDPPGEKVYAWAVEGASEPQYVTVLNKPPVDSPLTAVRAWLVSEARK